VNIALLTMIHEVTLFGIETVVVTTGGILEVGEEEGFTVDNFKQDKALLKNASVTMLDSILAIYDELKEDIAADSADAILIISNAEQEVAGFPQKVEFFLEAADVAQSEGAVTADTVNEIVMFITELLNGIISLISGIVTTVIGILSGIVGAILGIITSLIDLIITTIAGIINTILSIFGLSSVAVSSEALQALSTTVGLLEGSLTLSQLAACLTDQDGCPEDATEADVACQVEYLECVHGV